MKSNVVSKSTICFSAVSFSIIIFFFISTSSCNNKKPTLPIAAGPDTIRDWVSYNVLNKVGSDSSNWRNTVDSIKAILTDSLNAWNSRNDVRLRLILNANFCPCDSLLFNLDAKTVGGVSVNQPPPPPKPPAGSGDSDSVIAINYKVDVDPFDPEKGVDSIHINIRKVNGEKVLAIIDTGLDTTKFNTGFGRFLWKDPHRETMFNFLPGQDLHILLDDHKKLHGTTVAAMALQPSERNKQAPSLMILKALDSNKLGTIFSVSCAMSYAIQNNVTLINTSLGYQTDKGNIGGDPVLRYYISLSNNKQIPIFTAAGNVLEPRSQVPGECDSRLSRSIIFSTLNELIGDRLFYPACFNVEFPNLISVTGLKNADTACGNQNYSSTYVSVGLLNENECCRYGLANKTSHHFVWNRGSSFATPIVAGLVMNCLLSSGDREKPLQCLRILEKQIPVGKKKVTKDGNYILWDDKHK